MILHLFDLATSALNYGLWSLQINTAPCKKSLMAHLQFYLVISFVLATTMGFQQPQLYVLILNSFT